MFRVSNGRKPNISNEAERLRYVMIFRLNRPKLHIPKRLRNSRFGPNAPGANTTLGNFSLEGIKYLFDSPVVEFDPIDGSADHDNCFTGPQRADDSSIFGKLNRLHLGARVTVRLQPITPTSGGGVKLGRVYVRHPRLLPMRVHNDDVTGVLDQVASPNALRAIRAIGCSATVVD